MPKKLLFVYNLAGTVLYYERCPSNQVNHTVSVGIFVPTNSYISACYKSCPSACSISDETGTLVAVVLVCTVLFIAIVIFWIIFCYYICKITHNYRAASKVRVISLTLHQGEHALLQPDVLYDCGCKCLSTWIWLGTVRLYIYKFYHTTKQFNTFSKNFSWLIMNQIHSTSHASRTLSGSQCQSLSVCDRCCGTEKVWLARHINLQLSWCHCLMSITSTAGILT